MTLDVVDHLAALGDILGAPLADQHVGHDGVVDVTLVLEFAGVVLAVEEIVGFLKARLRTEGHGVKLAVEARADVGAVLLLVQLGVDTDILEVLEDELSHVDQDGGAVSGEVHGRREALGIAGFGHELPGLAQVVLVPASALSQLIHRHRPLLERGRHRRIECPHPLVDGIDDPLTVDGERHGAAHPHVAERRLVSAHGDVGHDSVRVLGCLEPGPLLLEGVPDLHPVHAIDHALVLPAEVVLARDEGGHARGIVLVHRDLDPVDIGLAGHEVARITHEGVPDIGSVAVEHPGAAAHGALVLLEIAELLHALLRDDGDGVGVGEHVEEPDIGLLERELDRVLVLRLDLVEGRQHVGIGVARDRLEALHAVDDVIRRELAPIHWRLVLPAHALAKLEDVRGLVGLGPGFGEVAFDRERSRLDARPGLVLEQTTMGEGVGDVGLVGDRQVRVPVRRVPEAERECSAALGRLRARR